MDIVKVFGPEARPLVAQLTTEGQHRGAVIAALQDRKRDSPEPMTTAPTAAGAHVHGHEASSLTTCQLAAGNIEAKPSCTPCFRRQALIAKRCMISSVAAGWEVRAIA